MAKDLWPYRNDIRVHRPPPTPAAEREPDSGRSPKRWAVSVLYKRGLPDPHEHRAGSDYRDEIYLDASTPVDAAQTAVERISRVLLSQPGCRIIDIERIDIGCCSFGFNSEGRLIQIAY